ncbi:MAG: transporter substrate-binding domain-containing protein [Alphaproteobacteria bacterium]|nr:transporter substrate-binding domain-containing protein [Alphaproteobacteria bacterium]MBQ7285861.1 transporter substrate-binding domain-containing protein [Alphaproteobacteria bacterium]
MKKIVFCFLTGILLLTYTFTANAFVRYEDKHPQKRKDIYITGFIDYPPFGFVEHPNAKIYGKFTTLFQPMIDELAKENNLRIFYDLQKKDFQTLVQEVRKGELDIILGAYHQTELFRGLELIYPAAINNPITIFMLPNRINEVKSVDDLKKLKGVRITKEVYSDYINEQLKQFNMEEVDTSYKMFEKLFTKQVDYILVSHYYGLIEAIKLGLREQVAIAKQTLWQIPMFIGVSKLSRERKMLSQKLTRYIEKPENQKAFQDGVAKMIADFAKNAEGIVPPTFGLEKSDN